MSLRLPRSIQKALAALLFGALISAPAWSQSQPAPASKPARPAQLFRISGRVVDARTGASLSRCSVQIADVKERSQSRTVTTGDDGSFAFDGLGLGKYSLTAQRRGYLAQSYKEHDQYSTAIAVGPGLISDNLIFDLTAEAVLNGTVTDEAGEPVRGAQVRLFQDQDANGIRSTQSRQTVTTDDRGIYEIAGLKPGAYFLAVTAHPWYAQRLPRGETASSEAQALDLAYPTTYYPGVTDSDAATPIPMKGGDRLEANITLAAQPAMRLHVNLAPAGANGEPNRGVSILLSQSVFGQMENLPTPMTYTPGGAVEIDGVLPGHYDVTVGGSEAGPKHFQADVSGGATELSEDSGVGEVTVTGKVVSASGKLPPFAGISLRTQQGRRQEYGALNDAGEFSLTAVPGSYEVVGNMNGMYIASLSASGATLTGRTLTLKAGDSPKLNIVAGSGHAEIEGTVLRGDKPVSAVMVLLAPEDPKDNQILFRRDQSDSDGTFDIAGIVPGKYRLLAIERGWDIEWANPTVLQVFLARSIPIGVASGDHLKERIQVQDR